MFVALGAFAGHSSATATLGRQVGIEKAYASSFYFFFYYLGSSISGYVTGIFFNSGGWPGIVMVMVSLAVVGIVLTVATQPNSNIAR
jgi:YNFM family putative membrane transporter